MAIRTYSVSQLNHVKGEIWCWGCGQRFYELLELYQDEPFMKHVTNLVDSNQDLRGIKKKVGNRILVVKGFSKEELCGNKNLLIMITTDRWQGIYEIISKLKITDSLKCCMYPSVYYRYISLIWGIMRNFPTKRQMLFYAGLQPHENAIAIVKYLQNDYKGKSYKIIFYGEISETEKRIQGVYYQNKNTLKIKNSFFKNILFCWHYARTEYLFYENEPLKKENKYQKLIFLNHGTIPLKSVQDVLKQPEDVDYAICPSAMCADIYEEQYGISTNKQIYCMPPRIELFKKGKDNLERLFGLKGIQIIIWLPTFRALKGSEREDSAGDTTFELIQKEKLENLNEHLKRNDQFLVIKMHPSEKNEFAILKKYDRIQILPEKKLKENCLTLQEILPDTAALITDYSGIAFEYLLAGKPIGYVIADMEDYKRGFAYENPFAYMPGQKIRTYQQLLDFLDDVREQNDLFEGERKKLRQELFQGNDRKNAAEELIKVLEKI